MLKKIRRFLITKESKVTLVLSIAISILFTLYLVFIGMPATRSQNLFNDGVRAYEVKDYNKAKELFIEADNIWPHSEVAGYLDMIDNATITD